MFAVPKNSLNGKKHMLIACQGYKGLEWNAIDWYCSTVPLAHCLTSTVR
jgi:hypothetical protein